MELGKVTGEYKGEVFEIRLGKGGGQTKVFSNGKDISSKILAIDIRIRPNELTRIFLEIFDDQPKESEKS